MEQIPLKNSVLVVKKTAWFCSRQCPKQNETIQKKKSQRYTEDCLFEFWRSLATARDARCDAPVIWWGRNLAIFFAQINLSFLSFFFFFFNSHICLRVLWGIACICMINICMADNQHVITDCSQISVWMQSIYSQVHKYWDIDTILTFLALYTTTMDFKWNEQDVL